MKKVLVIGALILLVLCPLGTMLVPAITANTSGIAQAAAQIEASQLTGQIYRGEHTTNVLLIVLIVVLVAAVIFLVVQVLRLTAGKRMESRPDGEYVKVSQHMRRIGPAKKKLSTEDVLLLLLAGKIEPSQVAGLLGSGRAEEEEIDQDHTSQHKPSSRKPIDPGSFFG